VISKQIPAGGLPDVVPPPSSVDVPRLDLIREERLSSRDATTSSARGNQGGRIGIYLIHHTVY
jgi:hypothetical protein